MTDISSTTPAVQEAHVPQTDALLERMKTLLPGATAVKRRDRRYEVDTTPEQLLTVLETLKSSDLGFGFVCTIVGFDDGTQLGTKYILGDKALVCSVTVRVPNDNPVLPTSTGIFPASVLYEREVHDVVGIRFTGHPNLSRLILADDWPEAVYPLRKDYQFFKDEAGIPVKGCLLVDTANKIQIKK
ncbi:MAG TPA: NADH-quinone oxidoreductase subunit C [bacterium]|nr:NADH-quinone oxidoreductase subunit C [bacterium]